MLADKIRSCCFTGYRPSKFKFKFSKDDPEYREFENRLINAVFDMPEKGCVRFYCGMAMGFDILAGEIVVMLRQFAKHPIELVAVVPFKGQADNWPPQWQLRYNELLSKADSVIYISDEYDRGCYQRRNRYMVDNSDTVLTFFNGEPGGTAQTVAYARKKNKNIINIADFPVQLNFPLPYVIE